MFRATQHANAFSKYLLRCIGKTRRRPVGEKPAAALLLDPRFCHKFAKNKSKALRSSGTKTTYTAGPEDFF
eukprot:9405912-Ditylum_brightwellii.AAC.1